MNEHEHVWADMGLNLANGQECACGAVRETPEGSPSEPSLTDAERRDVAHTFHGTHWLSPERAACVERIVASRVAAAKAEAWDDVPTSEAAEVPARDRKLWLQGYEFALRNLADDPVQADLRGLLAADDTEGKP